MKNETTEVKASDAVTAPVDGDVMPYDQDAVKRAFQVIRDAMIADEPSEAGSYAHSWHCNIAMMCYDAMRSEFCDVLHEDAYNVSNDAASRFMKLCFDVETKE